MEKIKTSSLESLKILMIILVLINFFCCACSSNDNSPMRRNIKGRLGTHWNRIGKRFETKSQQQEEQKELQEIQESQSKSPNLADIELCKDLLLFKYLAEKYQVWMKLEQFIDLNKMINTCENNKPFLSELS